MLSDSLKVLLASTYAYAIKSQNFHWNIEGPDFPQYHKFYGKLYDEVNKTLDVIAEYIRVLDNYAPGSLSRFIELSIIKDQTKIPRAELMFAETLEDSENMKNLVMNIFDEATNDRQQGIANYMAELQDLYAKQIWFIKSILKKERQ
jgi:starvation-inducible DNA-binding protein